MKIESSATLPTTSRLMASHPVGGGKAQQSESVAQHLARGAGQHQAGLLGGRRLAQHPAVVIPAALIIAPNYFDTANNLP